MVAVLFRKIHDTLAWLEIREIRVVLEGPNGILTLKKRLSKTRVIEATDSAICWGSTPYHADVRSSHR